MGLFSGEADKITEKGVEALDGGNYAEALALFNEAAGMGDAVAMYRLGKMYSDADEAARNEEMPEYWRIRKHVPSAAAAAAVLVALRASGESINRARAAYWFKMAAKKGNAAAIFNLGFMYSEGKGVARNHAKAAHWYKKAAKRGNAGAMFNLSLMYNEGYGVLRNAKKAEYWRDKAEEINPMPPRY